MGHVDGRLAAGQHIGCDHTAEKRRLQATSQTQGFDVLLLLLEEAGNGCLELLLFAVLDSQRCTSLNQILDLGVAQQYCLARLQCILALEVLGLVEQSCCTQALHGQLRQWFIHTSLDQLVADEAGRLTRTHGHRHLQSTQCKGVIGHTPVALEALRGNARAHLVTVGQALGEACVVAVEQGRWVVVQGVDLQETGQCHGFSGNR